MDASVNHYGLSSRTVQMTTGKMRLGHTSLCVLVALVVLSAFCDLAYAGEYVRLVSLQDMLTDEEAADSEGSDDRPLSEYAVGFPHACTFLQTHSGWLPTHVTGRMSSRVQLSLTVRPPPIL